MKGQYKELNFIHVLSKAAVGITLTEMCCSVTLTIFELKHACLYEMQGMIGLTQ